ncbi:MAG: TRAP transporter small permease subunit [Sneathiellaceae bacterium]
MRRLLLGATRHGLGAGLAFIAGLAVLQVVLRYVFANSITWVEEISVLVLLWIAWIGAIHLWLDRSHIAVDLLLPHSGPWRARLIAAFDLAAVAGGLALAWAAEATIAAFGGVVMGSLELPGEIKFLPVLAGGIGLALAGLVNLLAGGEGGS